MQLHFAMKPSDTPIHIYELLHDVIIFIKVQNFQPNLMDKRHVWLKIKQLLFLPCLGGTAAAVFRSPERCLPTGQAVKC